MIKKNIWSQEQVDALNKMQQSRVTHPYTCPNRVSPEHKPGRRDLGLLVATTEGWVCPECGYRQEWAHNSSLTLAMQMQEEGNPFGS